MTSPAALEWRERVRLHQQAKREARYAAGLCGNCGERPPSEGRKTCDPCLERMRLYNRGLRASRRVLPTRRSGAT